MQAIGNEEFILLFNFRKLSNKDKFKKEHSRKR